MTQQLKPLNIAVIAACPFPYPRGTPVRILRLSEAVAERGHKVHVATYHLGDGSVPRMLDIVRTPVVKSYNKVSPGPSIKKLLVLDPMLVRTVRQLLDTQPIDVIHAHHYEGLIVGKIAARGRGIPLVYDAHTLLGSELPYFGGLLPASLTGAVGRLVDHRLPRLADHVVAVTEAIEQKLSADPVMRGRVTVVQNGVEHELFSSAVPDYAARAGGKLVVFSGNLAQYQGIDHLLRAFAIVAARRADVQLMFVTESAFDEYEPLARELGIRERIIVKPAAFRDTPALLAAADVLVNPRTACDGIPQKLLNYMAAGKAIVSFAGSAPCLEHGRTGLIVEDADANAFAEAVLSVLGSPDMARDLGARAREYVLLNRTWEKCAALTEGIYLRLLQEAGRR
jgi:glycosyltransferase involved in cell wall biosynthesis